MKKMPCLFVREFHGRQSFTLTEAVSPGCEWVLAGEGRASIKRDGTACLVKDGVLYKRYDAKVDRKTGEWRKPPEGAIPCDEPDPVTGHWPHWVLVNAANPADRWHVKAWDDEDMDLADGTYELCGPQFNGNPEGLTELKFFRHGIENIDLLFGAFMGKLSFVSLKEFLFGMRHEGIVFDHPDGRFAKIRRRDFGFEWPLRVTK